ncbi:TRAP-type C4-dicarboxylate transport system permease small subunit [Breoghania corrubedonensis]|uniref:TRAP transporter small permease protein n=1 Tax=Breoghania corrubedonensis TaxID=665038 RepID=A0A2T5V8Y4_9HYPH|nr:TRAP transporter small permease subunit [Breoghania corrubedonensis]PTW60213.1 TRAP-type C4-dicarboxylate transport system permease small subunit [Breoghania corrubedonensis]
MIFLSLVDRLSRALAFLSGAVIFGIALLVASEIFLRNIVGVSLSFVWEVSVYLHMCAIFLGAAWTLRTGGHIRVTLLRAVMPRLFEWFATLIGLVISAYVTNALTLLAWGYYATGRTSGSTTDVPLVYPAAFIAFGSLLLTVQIALRLVHLAMGRPVELDSVREEGANAPIMD